MSLYGRTDSAANVTKAGRGIAASSQAKTIVFVDETEAALESNKKRGINAPGWWSYFTYTDGSGKTRHKAEHLVTLANADLNANETQSDDTIAADVAVTISITQQPTQNANPVSLTDGANGSVAMSAIATPPGDASVLTFQWQKLSGDNWSDVAGQTSSTLSFTPYAAADAGEYRCKINSTNGGAEVISNVLTVQTA